MSGEKDLIWLPKAVCDRFKALEGQEADDYILAHYEARRQDIHNAIHALDEDIIEFKAKGIAYKRAFAEAWDAERLELDKIADETWAKFAELRKDSKRLASEINEATVALRKQLQEAKTLLEDFPAYKAETIVDTLTNMVRVLNSLTPEIRAALSSLLQEKPNDPNN